SIASSSISFRNLKELQAVGCKGLKHLVTSTTAKSLEGLISMKIFGCRAMTEVVVSDQEEDGAPNLELKQEVVFSKLKRLDLCDLDSLTSFCPANYAFKFPSLQDLSVIGCPKLKIFTTGTEELRTPPRVNVWYGERDDQLRWASNDLNTTIQQLHLEKVQITVTKPYSIIKNSLIISYECLVK
ncbi:hypothetical protein CISIN_1g044424mg, partial [Citrus sinensis]